MTTLHQQPVSAFEVYEPSEREKSEGKWAAVAEKLDEFGEIDWSAPVHIIPIYDKRFHLISVECWCGTHPRKDDSTIILHEASQ